MPGPLEASACCSATCAHHVTMERRRSDFERDLRVTPFTGSCCCCCCCLHWIGAAAGGIVGMRLGYRNGMTAMTAPLPETGRITLRNGVIVGTSFTVVLTLAALVLGLTGQVPDYLRLWQDASQMYLAALAIVPSLAFLPVGAPMERGPYRLRGKMLRAFRKDMAKLPAKEGSGTGLSLYRAKLTVAPKTRDTLAEFSVFCPHCWSDVAESLHLATCPRCDKPLDHPAISGPDYGVKVAWRATLVAFGLSTAGTVMGYVLMLLISLLFG